MAKQIRPPRPRTRALRAAYKGIASPLAAHRIEAMAKAMTWFDTAKDYIVFQKKGVVSAELASKLDKAVKARTNGIGTTHEGKRETSFKMACRFYEKFCDSVKRLPSVDKAYEQFELRRERLEKRQQHTTDRFSRVVSTMQAAFEPANVAGRPFSIVVSAHMEKDRSADPMLQQYMLSRNRVLQLQAILRAQGLLPMLFAELEHLAKACGIEKSTAGHFARNIESELSLTHKMLAALQRYLVTPAAPKKVIRSGTPQPVAAVASGNPAPKRPGRAFGKKGPVEKVGGGWIRGSSIAVLYEAMQDGQWHPYADLQKLVTANVVSRVTAISKDPTVLQVYKFELEKTRVRMTKK